MRKFLPLLLPLAALAFDSVGWKGYKTMTVVETSGLAREREPVDAPFAIPTAESLPPGALCVVLDSGGAAGKEVPSQFYKIKWTKDTLVGRVVFFCKLNPKETKKYRLYYGNRTAPKVVFPSDLSVRPAEKGPVEGPMHWIIENEFYKAESYPKNGQIWHLWNKKGANTLWWFKEWNDFDMGGDPIHWSPNVWVAHSDRAANGVIKNPFDWHYVVGWVEPEYEFIQGPLFCELKRWGLVWPHPEHSDTNFKTDQVERLWAEVTYRFYAGLPWYYQSSTFITKEDLYVYFIRNNQMVFKDGLFSHLALMPETPGLLPGDKDEICFQPLLGYRDSMPFSQHGLSNIIPSKISFYSLFNPATHDAFANLQLLERNSREPSGEPVMTNHAMILTQQHNWAVYFARTFNYTNKRFNPENAVFLPKTHRFEEENIYSVFRYDSVHDISKLQLLYHQAKHPLTLRIE